MFERRVAAVGAGGAAPRGPAVAAALHGRGRSGAQPGTAEPLWGYEEPDVRRGEAPSCGTRENLDRCCSCAQTLARPPASAGGPGGRGRSVRGARLCARSSEEVRRAGAGCWDAVPPVRGAEARLAAPQESLAELLAPTPVFKGLPGPAAGTERFAIQPTLGRDSGPAAAAAVRMAVAAGLFLVAGLCCVCTSS